MPKKAIALAERIVESRALLDQLWRRPRSSSTGAWIRKRKEELDVQVMRLISINIQQRGEEYEAATLALEEANAGIEAAIADLNRVAAALEALATGLELVAKVKPV